nr:MAG TPA: hypothetical protein [Caudoviricetes sp.]
MLSVLNQPYCFVGYSNNAGYIVARPSSFDSFLPNVQFHFSSFSDSNFKLVSALYQLKVGLSIGVLWILEKIFQNDYQLYDKRKTFP